MARNPGDYVIFPKPIGDALYNAPTAASATNPFVTLADLNSAVGLNNELSEILANGNITDGNDIAVSTGDSITGVVELTLSAAAAVDVVGATGVTITATTGDVSIESGDSSVGITGALDVDLTATAGSIRLRSDVTILDTYTISSATAGVTLDFGSGLEFNITAPIFSAIAPIIDLTVTQLKLNLIEYADNTAALGAGLVAGDSYILAATKAVTVVV